MRVAAKAKRLSRKMLAQCTVLFTPDKILGWFRKLIAEKYDGSKNRKKPGRPQISQEIVKLVIKFKEENPRWGYKKIADQLVYLKYTISKSTVKNILIENGYDPEPDLTVKSTEAFEPAEARRLAEKLEIHHTPKHGSWLNMAEIELSILSRQCMKDYFESIEQLTTAIAAWERLRNKNKIGIDWQFTTTDARIKLRKLYPTI